MNFVKSAVSTDNNRAYPAKVATGNPSSLGRMGLQVERI
jgi:hypothetical protein